MGSITDKASDFRSKTHAAAHEYEALTASIALICLFAAIGRWQLTSFADFARVGWATFRSKWMSLMAGADLLSTYFGFVSAVTGEDSSGTDGALRLPVVQLALFVSMMSFAVLMYVHPPAWPEERSSSGSDARSLTLIVVISFLSLLASVWAAFFGAAPSGSVP
jgi:hypothetical protein